VSRSTPSKIFGCICEYKFWFEGVGPLFLANLHVNFSCHSENPMPPRFLLALTLLLFTAWAHAVECDSATDQSSMNQCAAQQSKAADKELNAHYQQITARLKDSPDSKKLMVSAQRAWVAFRDAECTFSASGVEGGSVYPLIYSNCITELTKARVETFKNYLKCQEGDLSCPVPGV
jgi:uncharacterized protein YecT (DUF1311 family)